jgi:hypothetical protein
VISEKNPASGSMPSAVARDRCRWVYLVSAATGALIAIILKDLVIACVGVGVGSQHPAEDGQRVGGCRINDVKHKLAKSKATLAFDNQNPGFASRMCNMLTSHPREKDVANRQCHDLLDTRLAIMHIDRAVENCKYLLTIIHMPFVRLVGPVETSRGSAHIGDVISTPSASGGEILAPNNSHHSRAFKLV